MYKVVTSLLIIILASPMFGQITERIGHVVPEDMMPKKANFHIYMMAGQSNMAGRGIVAPEDEVLNKRVLSINKHGDWVFAEEPLHFHEPSRVGLDCGKSFAEHMADLVPDSIIIGIIPTAVGGSSVSQWLEDPEFRGVHLLSNFEEKVNFVSQYGTIKGIIWHQGESDSHDRLVDVYKEKMDYLRTVLRRKVGNDRTLPFIFGELGDFWAKHKNPTAYKINEQITSLAEEDRFSGLVVTSDLDHKGDTLHFGSEAQRTMGKRYANEILKLTFSDDEKAIRANNQAFSLHIMNGNYDGVIAAYSNTAIIFPPGNKVMDKKEEIRRYWTPSSNGNSKNIYHRIIPQEIKIFGDFATDWGRYEGATLREDGSEVSWGGKYIVHWIKNKKSEWKIDKDIWNGTN